MADVFNQSPVEFVNLNELFPVLNSAVGITYEQFRVLVENTFWLKNQEEIGVIKAYIVSGSSQFGALWLSDTDGGAPLIPSIEYIYIIQTDGIFKNKIFTWDGNLYEQLAKDSDNNYTDIDKAKVDIIITDGDGTKALLNDGTYGEVSGGGGIPDAPSDDKQYLRKNGEWQKASRLENGDNTDYIDVDEGILYDFTASVAGGTRSTKLSHNYGVFETSNSGVAGGIVKSNQFKLGFDDLILRLTSLGNHAEYKHSLNFEWKTDLDTGEFYLEVSVYDEKVGIGATEVYEFRHSGFVNKIVRFKDIISTIESFEIETTDWSALASSEPYNYSTNITLTSDLDTNTVIELLNNQAVLFATHGFAIGEISGQDITIYSIDVPSSNVTLSIKVGNLYGNN